jgi:two-component system OmpR family response regulator
MRVLLVEDERDLASALARALGDARFAVDVAANGPDGLVQALAIAYDAVVLDVMLPGLDGWEVLRSLRDAGRATPVLMLTARDAVEDRVRGLDLGADDYLTKPFAVAELVARLRALGRRTPALPPAEVRVGNVRIDLAGRRVYRSGCEIDITGRELEILALLARQRGQVVSRTEMSEHLYNDDSELISNAIDVHVASIRRKLGAALIQTRRGVGYLIDA